MEPNGSLTPTKNIIDERYADAIVDILTRYLLGEARVAQLLENEPALSKSTYYRLKADHPQEWAELEQRARRAALAARTTDRLAFEARQETGSHLLRENARELLLGNLGGLGQILQGGTYEVEVLEYNRAAEVYESRRKTVVIYPRDVIAAAGKLHEIFRDIVPDLEVVPVRLEDGTDDSHVLPSFLGASTDFTKVSLTAADGRKVEISATQDGEVIEGEVQE
jgi:hypothetical protein